MPIRYLICLSTFFILSACTQKAAKSEINTKDLDSANYVSVVLTVNGMTCEGCENAITKGLGSLEGIKEVSASHIDSITSVVYDSTIVKIDMIVEKIDEIGYEVMGVAN